MNTIERHALFTRQLGKLLTLAADHNISVLPTSPAHAPAPADPVVLPVLKEPEPEPVKAMKRGKPAPPPRAHAKPAPVPAPVKTEGAGPAVDLTVYNDSGPVSELAPYQQLASWWLRAHTLCRWGGADAPCLFYLAADGQ